MNTIGERLKEYWVRDGIALRPPASADELYNFETERGVTLPDDLKSYFATVNGFEGSMDNNCFEFMPLERLTSLVEWWPKPDASTYFIIADFLIQSHVYAIRLTKGATDNHVVVCWGEEPVRIANSFSEFVDGYLEGKETILGY